MDELVPLYTKARQAIADCKRADELKLILDQAKLYEAAMRIAGDKELLADAAEIVQRAKLRLNDIMEAQKETVGLNPGGRPRKTGSAADPVLPTLSEAGISKRLAHEARTLGAMSPEQFEQHLEETRRAITGAVGKTMRQQVKKAQRDERMVELAHKVALIPDQRFVVAVMDPAWREEPYSRDTGLNKAPDNHYPTLTPDEIARLRPMLFDDAIVFCWTTVSMMRVGMQILEGWGLTYKSHMIWVKERAGKRLGLGRWSRVDHEIVLIYTQGRPPAPADDAKLRSVLFAPPGAHSEKPDEFYDMIRANYPDPIPKIDMYARKKRPGFVPFGNEVGD